MVQEEYTFDEPKPKESAMSGIGNFIWNSQTKEFLGRDGASWGKVSLFYAVFYACLGSFFVGMLAVFFAIMPQDKPMYYGQSSTMNVRKINPGLGFRPQVDVEDCLIRYHPGVYESDDQHGYKPLFRNLDNFLNSKYQDLKPEEKENVLSCSDGQTYEKDLEVGKSCDFNYKKIFESTQCTSANKFGFETNQPCILLKLNKIISWMPVDNQFNITCEGETSADIDNIKKVTYHSEGNLNSPVAGFFSKKYFPFYAQKSYRAPFIFVQFDVEPNTLVNVVCKANDTSIDNADRMNRRGQTKFSLLILNKKFN